MVAGAVVAKKRFRIGFAKRKLLVETYYVEHLSTSVCLELALRDDLPLVTDYLCSEYGDQKLDNAWIKGDESFTIIARDNAQICGVFRGTVVDHEKSENQVDSIFKDVPSNTERFFHIDCLHVDANYQGGGLGMRLWIESLKLAISSKCQYVTSLFPVGVSMIVANKVGMRLAKNTLSEAEPLNNGAYLMIYNLNDATELIAQNLIPKVPEAYRLRQAERPLIHAVFVKHLNREIKMEIAVPGDEPILQNYVINEFFKQTPLYVTLGFQTEDAIELAKNRLSPDLIADGRVIMVTDNSKLVGMVICRNVMIDRSPQKYDLLSSDVIDLTEEINKMPHVYLPIAKYKAVTSLINAQMSFCIPEDSGAKNFCVLQMGHLHANYRHYKLGFELGSSGLMLSYQKGHRFVQTMTTSIGSDRQTEAAGSKRMFDCPYSKFEYNGKPIFVDGKLCDGYDKASIFQMDLTEL